MPQSSASTEPSATDTPAPKGRRSAPAQSDDDQIRVRGARQHNLKNIDLELPRDQLIVFTGVSGSGKSSLAFDTIFAEGQRRYVESLSAYARQFLGQVDKPDVDAIEGLSPAISIDQKSTSHNPRSTVGTVTEIYDYLRLLFGRAGEPHCPHCDRAISPQSLDQMLDQIMALPDRTRFQILAPVVRGKKGTHKKLLSALAAEGFVRVRVDGEILDLNDNIELDKNHAHTIEVVVDRLVKKADLQERLADSLTTCLKRSEGIAVIDIVALPEGAEPSPATENGAGNGKVVALHGRELSDRLPVAAEGNGTYRVEAPAATPEAAPLKELVFSENFACPEHGAVMEELSPDCFPSTLPTGPAPTATAWAVCVPLPPSWWCRTRPCPCMPRSPPGPRRTIPIISPCYSVSVRPLALRFNPAGKP
jgi:excinuclease ABC subunit A